MNLSIVLPAKRVFEMSRQIDYLIQKLDEPYEPCPDCDDTGVITIRIEKGTWTPPRAIIDNCGCGGLYKRKKKAAPK